MVGWAELPRSGDAFYDRLQAVLIEAGFDELRRRAMFRLLEGIASAVTQTTRRWNIQ